MSKTQLAQSALDPEKLANLNNAFFISKKLTGSKGLKIKVAREEKIKKVKKETEMMRKEIQETMSSRNIPNDRKHNSQRVSQTRLPQISFFKDT